MKSSKGKCFACGRALGRNPYLVTCADEQDVFVGSECARLIRKAGAAGWQPHAGGPRLFSLICDPKGRPDFTAIAERLDRAHRAAREQRNTRTGNSHEQA